MKTLTINVHFRCNAKCIFCVVGIPDNKEITNNEFSYDEIVVELEQGRQKGCENLCLSGGEPTIYKDICKVIYTAKEMGYKCIEMKSNGIKLEDFNLVQKLKEAGLDIFCISIQGHEEKIHDYVVGVPGAFKALLKAVKNVKKVGGILYTPTCIQTMNYKYLPEIAEFYKQIHSDIVCPTFIEPNGSANENFRGVVPQLSDVLPYLEDAIEIIKKTDIDWSLHGFPLCTIKNYAMQSLDVDNNVNVLAGSDINDYNDYERITYRYHAPHCKECSLYTICNGVWKHYADVYGDKECIPIKSSITDILPVDTIVDSLFL